MSQRVMVGMSGGVDSSVAALLLQWQGYAVLGATLQLYPGLPGDPAGDARAVCRRLGTEHICLDFAADFRREVISRFGEGYACGRTPNPCVDCNRYIKFGRMLDAALENGCDFLATGHYARVERAPSGRWLLRRAADESKDQSYVLYSLSQRQLAHLLLPLGEYRKSEVRALARENAFASAERPESQDICFIPDGDYAAFLRQALHITAAPGDFLDEKGAVLGRHAGYLSYTVGQRRGLGVSGPAPYYVLSKNAAQNTVTLGFLPALMANGLVAEGVNYIAFDAPADGMAVTVKSGYRQKPFGARLHPLGPQEVYVAFDQPQRAVAPGQAAVFYEGDVVLGGGTITGYRR